MPSKELFKDQDGAYRDQVLPPAVTARVAVEAGRAQGWHRWVGMAGDVVSISRFGASAPYERLYQEFGLTPDHVAARTRALLAQEP
jgi:transketolase